MVCYRAAVATRHVATTHTLNAHKFVHTSGFVHRSRRIVHRVPLIQLRIGGRTSSFGDGTSRAAACVALAPALGRCKYLRDMRTPLPLAHGRKNAVRVHSDRL